MNEGARTLANRYLLQEAIGRGGMGVVLRARDQQLDRAVAIKLVSEVAEPEAKARFLAEARRTANVRHPSIVEVFDVGEDQGDAFLVMELLEGETLGARLAREESILASEAVAIASEICDALAAAHDAGLVHRDLKPANVFLVAREGDARRVKLLDFGIAKRIDGATARTEPDMLVGTLEYMSPEQIRGERIDGRADLYALGMSLYRMLVGAPAFDGDNAASLLHKHLSVAPVPPRLRAPEREIPAWLDALVMRLLAKEVGARPASARDVKSALANPEGEATTAESAKGAARATTTTTTTTTTASGARQGMRMVELDDSDGPSAPRLELELDRGGAQEGSRNEPERPVARVPLPLPVVVPAPPPLATAGPPLPSWLEPLARMPFGLSKRVTGYALFALFVYWVFFQTALVPTLFLLSVALVGALAMWASWRASR